MELSRFRLPLILLALTVLSGVARWSVSIQRIPGERVRFSHVHDVAWDANNGTIRRTGGDPYVVLALPSEALPLRRVSFLFQGPYSEGEGTFYIFQTPAGLKAGESAEVMTGEINRISDGFIVSSKLRDSTSLRLDLPDFLPRPVELRRVVLTSPFVDWSSWSFRLLVVFLTGTAVTAVRSTQSSQRSGAA